MAALLSACSTTALYPPKAPDLTSDDQGRLFQQSEQLLESQDWDQALSGFSRYLSQPRIGHEEIADHGQGRGGEEDPEHRNG